MEETFFSSLSQKEKHSLSQKEKQRHSWKKTSQVETYNLTGQTPNSAAPFAGIWAPWWQQLGLNSLG